VAWAQLAGSDPGAVSGRFVAHGATWGTSMKIKRSAYGLGLLFVLVALVSTGVARAEENAAKAPTPEPATAAVRTTVTPESALACTTAEPSDETTNAEELATSVAPDDDGASAAACRPCKGRRWCKCTYEGMPRSSCNPCCYTNDIGVTICLD